MRRINPMSVAPETTSIAWSSFRTARAALQTVPCPSCGEEVLQVDFDRHLDGCLDVEMFTSAPGSPARVARVETEVQARENSVAKAENSEREDLRDGELVEDMVHEGSEEIRELEDGGNSRDEHDKPGGPPLWTEGYTEGIYSCWQPGQVREGHDSRVFDGGTPSEIHHLRDLKVSNVRRLFDHEEEIFNTDAENEFSKELEVDDEYLEKTLGLAGYSESVCYDKTEPEHIRVTTEMAKKVAIVHKRVRGFELSLRGPIEAFPPLDVEEEHQEGAKQVQLSEETARKELALLQSRSKNPGDEPCRLQSINRSQSHNENDFGNCPVCGTRVPKNRMHAHIETCLEISGLSSAFV